MKILKDYFNQFHKIVWVLLIGTIFARGTAFMTLPFLSIYLSRNMDLHPLLIGLTVGISPLMATVGGFIGGQLSDRYGRKPIMLTSLLILALVYYGFSIANSPGWFIVLNALSGLSNSFFEPTSQALMSDVTKKEKRMRVFSLRYTAINIGASVGPLIGAFLANSSPKLTFVITGTAYFSYFIVLVLFLNTISIQRNESKKGSTFMEAVKIVRKDKILRYLILGVILINIGYAQVESNLPQFLEGSIEKGVMIYSVLLSINAVMVVLLQMPISHVAESYKPMQVLIVGSVCMSLGLFSFSFVNGWVVAILAMALLTIGEILIFPSNSILIDQLAEDHLRGTYFGAGQFRKIGHFFGPVVGGFFLSHFNGQIMFWIISIIALGSIFFFTLGNRSYVKLAMANQKNDDCSA
ncbi:MDR family MFS transporter [Neobacillus sp. D3-1R]|uniref:MDR family MFS transporter n=1 Tax=Neobacillus sp. D3-1R TaxID=3445778 RepID=UPI003FA03C41